MSYPVVTIDGPSGTGKGTISQMLAKAMGWHFLDSGAIYRVLALAAERHGIAPDNEVALETLASHLDVQFESDDAQMTVVILEGEVVTDTIRDEAVGQMASTISVLPKVREALVARQRAFCKAPGLVADGRDMGTVIFPEAVVKIYLDASPEERAQRRFNQLKGKGISANLARLCEELRERDARDSTRKASPMKPAADAIVVDTTSKSINDVYLIVKTAVDKQVSQ